MLTDKADNRERRGEQSDYTDIFQHYYPTQISPPARNEAAAFCSVRVAES